MFGQLLVAAQVPRTGQAAKPVRYGRAKRDPVATAGQGHHMPARGYVVVRGREIAAIAHCFSPPLMPNPDLTFVREARGNWEASVIA